MLLTDLHTDCSRGRSGGLVFPSLEEFSTVYCDPHFKGCGIVNKAEIDVFLERSCFFYDSADVDNLISGYSAFSKSCLSIWKFTVHILLKPGLENFEHYFTSNGNPLQYSCLGNSMDRGAWQVTVPGVSRVGHDLANKLPPLPYKGFGVVNKADGFLELSCFFDDSTDVGNLISGSAALSKTSLSIWKFTVHILLKLGLENFEHYFAGT